MARLFVSLVSDTEDNYPNYVPGWEKYGSDYDKNPAEIKWDWTKYWDNLTAVFRKNKFPVTWYLHVSPPMKEKLLEKFKDRINVLMKDGDGIGIHIHTFEWNEEKNKWIQSRDKGGESIIVKSSIDLFKKTLGFSPKTSRIGWNFMNNATMNALEKGGVLSDVTAIPGYYSKGMYGRRDNIMDWRYIDSTPYHPDSENYQKRGNMNILEIPISSLEHKPLFSSKFFTGLSGIKIFNGFGMSMIKKFSKFFDFSPHTGFTISPVWPTSRIKKIIDRYVEKAKLEKNTILVGYFHPSDIFDPKNGKLNHDFKDKVDEILKYVNSKNREVEIVGLTIPELYEELKKG